MVNFIEQAAKSTFPTLFGKKDALILRIGAKSYSTFESLKVTRDINTMCSSFNISFGDKWRSSGDKWPLVPGAMVGISIGQTPVINGYIDRVDVEASNTSRTIEIQGRDRTSDLIDSSASTLPKTEFKNVTLYDVAQTYASLFGILVSVSPGVDIGKPFEKLTVKQGSSVYEELERAAKLRNLLILSDGLGNLVITNRAGTATALPSTKNLVPSFDFAAAVKTLVISPVALVQGENILSAQATYDDSDRFQNYVVKGQRQGSDFVTGASATQVTGVAFDADVLRFRSKTIISEGPLDFSGAQKRAAWESSIRAAKSIELAIEVQGWSRSDGKLWDINEIVNVDAKFVGINSSMLITSVEFAKDTSGGTKTNLKLTRPDAFAKEPKNDPKKGLGWDKEILGSNITRIKALTK